MRVSGVQNNKVNNNFQNFIEKAKTAGNVLAVVVLAVAHPIIGPLGSLGCLFAAGYHGLAQNYHWRHSREKNENGDFIDGTALITQSSKQPYSDPDTKYTQEDLPRLKHEKERFYHQNAARDNLKWARGLAKCTIPIVGLFWALNTVRFMNLIDNGTGNDWHNQTAEYKLKHHITKLVSERKEVN